MNPRDAHLPDVPTKIVAALDRLARGHRAHRQAFASAHGLTPLQLELLGTVALAPPPEPVVGQLARELGVTQPTVTDSLLALERKGLLERRREASDRRRTSVELTGDGARLVDELEQVERTLRAGVASLPATTQATVLEALLDLIAHLVDAGVIDVARTCTTCRYHERDGVVHRCALLECDLPPAELRVNCPEHEPALPGVSTGR